jgi:hypothetical protein
VAVFEDLAKKRGFLWFGAGRDKDVRAASEAALRVVRSAAAAKGVSA